MKRFVKFYKDNRRITRNHYGRKVEQGAAIIAEVRVNKSIPSVRVESDYHGPRFEVKNGYFDYSDYFYLADASYPHNYDGGKYTNLKTAEIQSDRINRIEHNICK